MSAPAATVSPASSVPTPVLTLLVIVPLAWAVLLLFHQDPGGGVYDSLRDSPSRWLLVHLGSIVFIGLIAGVLWFVLSDLTGVAASIARVAIVPFVLFYGAGEAVLGVATAVLTKHANGVPASEQPAAAAAVEALWDDFVTADLFIGIGSVAWVVAVVSTSAALWIKRHQRLAPALLAVSSLVIFHAPPIGPVALVCFAVAIGVTARAGSAGHARSAIGTRGAGQ